MQKRLPPSRRAAAVRMLQTALPGAVRVERRHPDDPASPLEILTPSGEPVSVRLVSPDEPPIPSENSLLVTVLSRVSGGEHDDLRRGGSSFVDLSGVVHLRAPGLYIDRTDLAPVRLPASGSSGVDPYSDRASRVVRVLLLSPSARRWTTSELASAAAVDVSTASRVVRELMSRELVLDEAPGQGRTSRIGVVDPAALLDDWTRRYSWADNRQLRVAAPVGSVRRFLSRMGDLLGERRWAVSLHAGASLVAAHADFELIHVYVDGSSDSLALEKGWEPSPSGKLVLLEPSYANSVWVQQQAIGGVNVVSAIQLVLDLWHYRVRGREQAEHLIETALRPVWEANGEP